MHSYLLFSCLFPGTKTHFFCFVIAFLSTISRQSETLKSFQQIKLFGFPQKITKNVNEPIRIKIEDFTQLNIQFWFKYEDSQLTESEDLLGFISSVDLNQGWKLYCSRNTFLPNTSSYAVNTLEHAGSTQTNNFLVWNQILVQINFVRSPNANINAEVKGYLNKDKALVFRNQLFFDGNEDQTKYHLSVGSTFFLDTFSRR